MCCSYAWWRHVAIVVVMTTVVVVQRCAIVIVSAIGGCVAGTIRHVSLFFDHALHFQSTQFVSISNRTTGCTENQEEKQSCMCDKKKRIYTWVCFQLRDEKKMRAKRFKIRMDTETNWEHDIRSRLMKRCRWRNEWLNLFRGRVLIDFYIWAKS